MDSDETAKKLREIADEVAKTIGPWTDCPKCGAPPKEQEIRNYSMIWHDGEVYCKRCGSFVRDWDAG